MTLLYPLSHRWCFIIKFPINPVAYWHKHNVVPALAPLPHAGLSTLMRKSVWLVSDSKGRKTICLFVSCVRVSSWQYAAYKEIIRCTLFWQVWRESEGGVKQMQKERKCLISSHLLSYPFHCLGVPYPLAPCLIFLSVFAPYPLNHLASLSQILYYFLHYIVSVFVAVHLELLWLSLCLPV